MLGMKPLWPPLRDLPATQGRLPPHRAVVRCQAKPVTKTPTTQLGAVEPQRVRNAVSARLESIRSPEAISSEASTSITSAALIELENLVKRAERRERMVGRLESRRKLSENIAWAVRGAISVCFSAILVLDGYVVHHVSHGYGIWALITCVNCSERLQGDLLRKSLERSLGTFIGGVAAMTVLYADDYLVPEIMGWNARAEFYLADVAIFTIVGIYLRASNKHSPAFDYSYFLAVLSFDFLLLDSFSDMNQYQDSLARILMVSAGGVITCAVGMVVLPQFAGQELVAMTASAYEGTASILEVTSSSLVLPPSSSGGLCFASSSSRPINMAQVKRLADLSRYEIRFFPPQEEDGHSHRLPSMAWQLQWGLFVTACEAAADVREVCQAATMVFQAGQACATEVNAFNGTPYDVELVVMVEEAASVLRYCSDCLRISCKRTATGRRGGSLLQLAPPANGCQERLASFHHAREALHESLDIHNRAAQPCPVGNLQMAAVRLMASELDAKLARCVEAVADIEDAGLLRAPLSFK